MKTVTDYIRTHLLDRLGYPVHFVSRMPSLEELRQTEWSERFEQFMRNRLIMGAFRHARFGHPGKSDYDCIQSMHQRLNRYSSDGNLEHLVDVANLAMVEFTHGHHKNRHWAPQDDGEHTPRRESTC